MESKPVFCLMPKQQVQLKAYPLWDRLLATHEFKYPHTLLAPLLSNP